MGKAAACGRHRPGGLGVAVVQASCCRPDDCQCRHPPRKARGPVTPWPFGSAGRALVAPGLRDAPLSPGLTPI
jgi:hypothetical protein